MKNYKAFIFDMDLTLLNTIKTAIKSYSAAFNAVGVPFDEKTVIHHLSIPLVDSYHEISNPKASCEVFCEAFKKVASETFKVDSFIYEDAMETIKKLKQDGKMIGIVTNREMKNVLDITDTVQITSYFKAIITCDKVTKLKPDSEPILKALKELNVNTKEAVYIGDARNDCLAAKNADVDFICIERYNNCDFECSDIIHSLKEIID